MEILLTLLGVASSLFLDSAVKEIDRIKAKSNNITGDDILKGVKAITTAAKVKGSKALNQAYDRLNNINYPLGMGSSVKDYLTKVKNEATENYNSIRDKYSNIEQNLNNIEERASNLAALDDNARNSMSSYIDKLKDDATLEANKVEELSKGVENAIQ